MIEQLETNNTNIKKQFESLKNDNEKIRKEIHHHQKSRKMMF
jgi:hypothetical protein